MPQTTIKIGVSSCLVGQKVRYDATDKRHAYTADTLAEAFILVPVCPEVAIGLGVPRSPIHLEGDPARPRAIGVYAKNIDATEPLKTYGQEMARQLAHVSGYIFKSKSPSCGVKSVPVYHGARVVERGAGLFTREILRALPWLPVVEEADLDDEEQRGNFIERVFAYRRWQALMEAPSEHALREFHRRHTLSLMSHGRARFRALERLLNGAGETSLDARLDGYGRAFMQTLSQIATALQHGNVMCFAARRLNSKLDPADRELLLTRIMAFRQGQMPIATPLSLLRKFARDVGDVFLSEQYYLHPDPVEWRLREMDRLAT